MGAVFLNVGIVAVLILLEAVFVAAEISLVSLRDSQVKGLADRGPRGRRVANLVADPNRFLGAVQLGVTLTAILSSAFGAEKLTEPTQRQLEHTGLESTPAYVIAFLAIAVIIAFFTIVIGELVPKRLALQRAEGAAQLFAPALDRLASIVRPVIWALSHSTNLLVRLLGGDPGADREQISDEELRGLVASHESLSGEERHLIDEVFAAAERLIREVMVPRTEVTFIEGSATVASALRATRDLPHSRTGTPSRVTRRTTSWGSSTSATSSAGVSVGMWAEVSAGARTGAGCSTSPATSPGCPRARTSSLRCRRCVAAASTWRSWSTSTAARPAS